MRLFLIFCLVMCLFSNAAYTQTNKAKAKIKQKELLVSQLEQQIATLLTAIETKRGQNQEKKKLLEMELANIQAQKVKTKKAQAEVEQKMQELNKKIASLENRDKEYQRMKDEMTVLQVVVEEQHSMIASSSNKKTGTTTQKQQQKSADLETQTNTKPAILNTEEKKEKEVEKEMQLDENTISFLLEITAKRLQNQEKREKLEIELASLQSQKIKKNKRAEVEQKKQNLEKEIAVLENKDKEYQKVENVTIEMHPLLQKQKLANTQKIDDNATNGDLSIQNNNVTSKYHSQVSSSHSKAIVPTANVIAGYYVVFGSFKEIGNAERKLVKLQKHYSNVVVMGNDNPSGMYRATIGPYKTKGEAEAQAPKNVKVWVLRCGN